MTIRVWFHIYPMVVSMTHIRSSADQHICVPHQQASAQHLPRTITQDKPETIRYNRKRRTSVLPSHPRKRDETKVNRN